LDFHEILICGSRFNYADLHRWNLWDNIHGERKRNRMKTVHMEAAIPSPSLWRLGTLSEQSEGKLKESHRTARDVAIVVGRHVSPLRDKGWIIHNWGLMRICVGILRGSNWDLFLGCFIILKFFLYDYVKLCEGFLLPRGLRNILV